LSVSRERLESALADRYRFGQELAVAGSATYYLAEDLRHGRAVSIKVAPPAAGSGPAGGPLLPELAAAAQLQHPHILPLLDSRRVDGMLCVVTPYVEGETLRQRLERGPMPVPEVVRILADLADAVAYVHGRGLAGLDLTPETVLLSGRHTMLLPGLLLGAPADGLADQATDIEKLGALGVELLTGEAAGPPGPGRLEQLPGQAGPALARVIQKCLTRDPGERWPGAEALLLGLEPLLTPRSTTPVQSEPVAGFRSLTRLALGLALVLGAVALFLVVSGRVVRSAVSPTHQLTFDGSVVEAALSPDGRSLAYVVSRAGADHLVVRDLAGGAAVELASGPRVAQLQWTTGGKELGFWLALPDTGGLRLISRLGGSIRKLPYRGGAASFAPGGRWLAMVPIGTPEARIVDLESGDTSTIHLEGSWNWNYGFVWNPAGDRLAYVATRQGQEQSDLRLTDRDGRHQRLLVTDTTAMSNPVWSDDGQDLYYLSLLPTSTVVKRLSAGGGGRPEVVAVAPWTTEIDATRRTLSAAGNRLVIIRHSMTTNLGRLPLHGAPDTAAPVLYTMGTARNDAARIAPDGHEFAFLRWENGIASIEVMPIGGGERELLGRVTDGADLAWSPDGRRLAATATDSNGNRHVFVVARDGSARRRLALGKLSGYLDWLDNNRIVYQRVGNRAIGLVDVTTGQDTVLPGPGPGFVFRLRVTPDGRQIAVMRLHQTATEIGLFSPLDSTASTLLNSPAMPIRWSTDGRVLYAVDARAGPFLTGDLLAVPRNGGPATVVRRLPEGFRVADVDPERDLLLVTREETQSDGWMIDLTR
jgi:Tol biopolymer transport system component